jgi:hypothetical protein
VAIAVRPSPAATLRRAHLIGARTAAIATLVAVSAAVHVAAGWLRATPVYFSDEYMYAELGRSLAESGLPLVRGELAPFPALLYPALTAPAWLFADIDVAYRAIQLFGAVAMSLVCLPVYALARRLELGPGLAFSLAALSVAVPDLVYSGWILSETVAYPLLLAAVAVATVALAAPSSRSQLLFLALVALAAATRAQFAVLVPVYLTAVLVLALAERRLRGVVREQALPLTILGAGLAAAAAVGPTRFLGIYRFVFETDVDPGLLAERAGANALVLAYASAWILLPGALLGFALALARPRSRVERAYAALAVPLVAALVLQASLFGAPELVQERYAFYSLPLLALAFGLYASRGWPWRTAHALIAAVLLCAVAAVPLSGYEKTHSAVLQALGRLEVALADPAAAALLAAAVAGGLLLIAIAASFRPRVGTPVVLGLAVVASALGALGATSFDLRNAELIRAVQLPADRSWVDHTVTGRVTLLRTPGGIRTEALEQLFWNRSVDRVALLPGAIAPDGFQAEALRIDRDGAIGVDEPLLVETKQSWVELRGAHRIAATDGYALWAPVGRARLALLLAGRYADGWLTPGGVVTVWPDRGRTVAGRLRIELTAPDAVRRMTFTFRSRRSRPMQAVVPGGATRAVVLTICAQAPWSARFSADQAGFVGSRLVSGRAGPPVFTPDPRACRRAPVVTLA